MSGKFEIVREISRFRVAITNTLDALVLSSDLTKDEPLVVVSKNRLLR